MEAVIVILAHANAIAQNELEKKLEQNEQTMVQKGMRHK